VVTEKIREGQRSQSRKVILGVWEGGSHHGKYLSNLGGKKRQDGKVANKGFRVCLDIKRESSSGISSIKERLN
jgi:hypothetical protein